MLRCGLSVPAGTQPTQSDGTDSCSVLELVYLHRIQLWWALQITNGTGLARQLQGNSQATLPPGIAVCSATVASLSAPHISKRIPKRALFMLASTLGVVGGILLSIAGWKRSFLLLCISGAPQGAAYGISNLYRFFAVDTTMPQHREKALAAVVGGAVLSAFIGPEAGRHLRLSLDQEFLAPFILSACLWVAQVNHSSLTRCTCGACDATERLHTPPRCPTPPATTLAVHLGVVCGLLFASTDLDHLASAVRFEHPQAAGY